MILRSKGFKIGSYSIEKFSLHKGEYLSVDFPSSIDFDIEKSLFQALCGNSINESVFLKEEIIPVIIPTTKYKLSFLSRTLASNYLKNGTNYSEYEITNILKKYGIDPNMNIYRLGATEKLLLALEKAYCLSKNIIISTAGIDYNGMISLRERTKDELSVGSIIELNYTSSRGRNYLYEKLNYPIKRVKVQMS